MSFTYIFEIKVNKNIVETMTTKNMTKGHLWVQDNTIEGDLVVVSEAYMGADGDLDMTDHITSFYVDT